VLLGPYASVSFECYDSMWIQIHEMLRIEGGGREQAIDEVAAYAPLVPAGSNLVATLMFEIDDRDKRLATLRQLGHVEDTVYLSFGSHRIMAVSANDEVERTSPDGKTSAVHFLSFPLSPAQVRDTLARALSIHSHSMVLTLQSTHDR